MDKLPEVCKECAEYGSDFCEECLDELTKNMPDDDKLKFNKVLQNLAHGIVTDRKK